MAVLALGLWRQLQRGPPWARMTDVDEAKARREERLENMEGREQSQQSAPCDGGPVAWMIRKSLVIQRYLQVLFGWVAARVIAHPNRCIWGT